MSLGLAVASTFAAVAMSAPPTATAAEPLSPQPTMRLVFEEIRTLLPTALDEARWNDPASRSEVLEALGRLEAAATLLERHGVERAAGFDALALTLGRDLRDALDHYARGDVAEARFFFFGGLQSCVSCHVRLPTDASFPMSRELTSRVELASLEPRERAWLSVVVRRFDEALEIWEALLTDPSSAPGQLDANGVLVDYLNVALRVRTDPARARSALTRFARREDLPLYLERRVATWLDALGSLPPDALSTDRAPSVDRGEAMAREAGRVAIGPFGRDGLVQDLVAASELARFLEADRAALRQSPRNRTPEERTAVARAAYWLGVVEARSLDGFWINLSERHFETAIRADPGGPWAAPAYAALEEVQVIGFGGASGEHLPADVWTDLRELRELIEQARPAAPGATGQGGKQR